MTSSEYSVKELVKFVVLLAIITLLSIWLRQGVRGFMGVFLLVFASFKFIGYNMFVEMYPMYDVVAERWKPWARIYPFIELALGILYIANLVPVARDVVTVIIMAVSSVGVFRELRRRRGIHCACLGNIIKLPLSTVSLVEDVAMGAMALFMLLR